MSEEFGLKRVLGLGDLVAIEVGTTVGAGIFSLTALAASYTGASAPLAFAAAAVPIVFIMMTVGMLGSALPTVGGTYRYPSRLFSPAWATTGVWCYAIAMVFGALPLYAVQCVNYLTALWPALPPTAAAIALLTVFYLVNILGIEIAAGAQALMVAVFLVALLVFGIWGAPSVDPENFTPLFSGGAGGFIVAACVLTFALQGSNSVIELGAEIKRPTRNIPLSLAISIPLVAALYILVSAAAVGNVDLGLWKELGDDASLAQPARNILPTPLFYFFMVGGAFFAFTTTLNGTFMWATKSLLVVARDRIMPPALAKTTKRGAPALFLTILWFFSSAAVGLDGLGRAYFPDMEIKPIEIFASYATIGGMIIFIPAMISALVLPRRIPEAYNRAGFKLRGPLLWIAPIIGIVTSVLLILILFVTLKLWSLPIIGWAALGLGFHVLRRRAFERRTGEDFGEFIRRDLAEMERSAMGLAEAELGPNPSSGDE